MTKLLAMLSSKSRFVVKFPKARVDDLVRTSEASANPPMKEWLEVNSESAEEWLQLAQEAVAFVGS